jgi:serine/threonine-protein kinase
MLEPPTTLPADLAATLIEEDRDFAAERSRKGTFALLALFALGGFLPWADVKSWPLVVAYQGTIGLLALASWTAHRQRRSWLPALVLGGLVVTTLFARVCGPFMLTPIIGCGMALSMAANNWFNERAWAVAGWIAAVTAIPVGLELTGVVSPTWGIDSDLVWIRSAAFRLHPAFASVVLVVASLLTTIALALYARALHRARYAAQRRISIQAWHLRKLLPTELPQ